MLEQLTVQGSRRWHLNSCLHALVATVPGMCFVCCASISILLHQDRQQFAPAIAPCGCSKHGHLQQYLCHSTYCNAPFPATTSLPAIHPSPTMPPHPTPPCPLGDDVRGALAAALERPIQHVRLAAQRALRSQQPRRRPQQSQQRPIRRQRRRRRLVLRPLLLRGRAESGRMREERRVRGRGGAGAGMRGGGGRGAGSALSRVCEVGEEEEQRGVLGQDAGVAGARSPRLHCGVPDRPGCRVQRRESKRTPGGLDSGASVDMPWRRRRWRSSSRR